MALSARAQQMLTQGRRDRDRIDPPHIVAALERAGLPIFEPIVAFQQRFGCITYRVRGSGHGMTFSLFLPEIDAFTRDTPGGQRYYFACGQHRVAQFGFYLEEEGTLCVDEGFAAPLAIASSVEKYIESDAMVSELIDLSFRWWAPLGGVAQQETTFRERLELLGLPMVAEASDVYTTWWGDERVRVMQRVFWAEPPPEQPPQKVIVAYVRTPSDLLRVQDALRDLLDAPALSSLLLRPWPEE